MDASKENLHSVELDVPVKKTDTDEILLQKARNCVPVALKKIGEWAAKEAWTSIEKNLLRSPLLSVRQSERQQFLRDTAREVVQNATQSDKEDIVRQIFRQLKEIRDEKRDGKCEPEE